MATKAELNDLNTSLNALIDAHGGVPGPAGAAGAPGSVWFTGSGAPSSGTGINGDYYLNTTTADVYHKAGGAWGPPIINLKGANGTQGPGGANGSVIYTGAGAPSSSVGVANDFYVDLTPGAVKVYTKTSGGWSSGVLISGTNGTNILTGAGAPSSGTGNNGDVYVDQTNAVIYGPKASGAWPTGTPIVQYPFLSQSGSITDYTLTAADNNKVYGFGAGSSNPITIRVPSNLPAPFTLDIWQEGPGLITLLSDAGTSGAATGAALTSRGVASTTTVHHPGYGDVITIFCRYNGTGVNATGQNANVFIANGVT